MQGKTVLLIISGGIAAYKALELIRRLKERGVRVVPVLTRGGAQFVTPLSIAALAEEKVHTDLFSLTDEVEMGHIQLSRAADLVVVAPATADLIAKMATGQADDLATTLLLATDTKVLVAPAMNVRMWTHPATQSNVARLASDGVSFVGPDVGDMACGEYGPGRLAEVPALVDAIAGLLAGQTKLALPEGGLAVPTDLAGKRALVTSGPTREPIDPVRYISNHSSGKQGHAIAAALARRGAHVTLVHGPVELPDPSGVATVRVDTAAEMLTAVEAALPADVAVFAAAVADWRVEGAASRKMKKQAGGGPPVLTLAENPDILASVAKLTSGRPRLVIGFAAETDALVDHAAAKLDRKGCDWILANDVGPDTGTLGGDRNTLHLVTADGVEEWPRMDKTAAAAELAGRIARVLSSGDAA